MKTSAVVESCRHKLNPQARDKQLKVNRRSFPEGLAIRNLQKKLEQAGQHKQVSGWSCRRMSTELETGIRYIEPREFWSRAAPQAGEQQMDNDGASFMTEGR